MSIIATRTPSSRSNSLSRVMSIVSGQATVRLKAIYDPHGWQTGTAQPISNVVIPCGTGSAGMFIADLIKSINGRQTTNTIILTVHQCRY